MTNVRFAENNRTIYRSWYRTYAPELFFLCAGSGPWPCKGHWRKFKVLVVFYAWTKIKPSNLWTINLTDLRNPGNAARYLNRMK